MAKTDGQKKADGLMEDAVKALREAYGLLDNNVTLVDYILVCEGMAYDADGDVDMESYGIVMRNGSARTTVAIGLLEKGRELLQTGTIVMSEEDEDGDD